MNKIHRFLLLATALVTGLASCQQIGLLSNLGVEDPTALFESAGALPGKAPAAGIQDNLSVKKVEFAPDYKTFSVWTNVVGEIGPYPLTDSTQVRIDVEELLDGVRSPRRTQPRLVKAWNTEKDQIKELGIKVLVLVDLSLGQDKIDAQRAAVEEMRTVFDEEILYVSFMSNTSVTPSRQVSDYILDTYFKNWSSKKCLFRSILEKMREMAGGNAPWTGANALKLVVFSDGKVYDDEDQPMDPDHFQMENEILQTEMGKHLDIYYVNLGTAASDTEDAEAVNVMTSLCEKTGGAYLTHFSWTLLRKSMLDAYGDDIYANRFDFVNPDGKVYRGGSNLLKLKFTSLKENRQIASATAHIKEGSMFRPVIVNGDPLGTVLFEGLSVGLFIMLAIYLICQFLIPFIRYRIFLRKHVVKYSGKNMIVNGIDVGQSCYLCKAPFEPGDEVVVKCEHTLHKHCWDENEYHCPEYGRHCQHGSHFYDREHLLDKRNAPYFMKWILMAVAASICAWMAFSLWTDSSVKPILSYLFPDDPSAPANGGIHLNQLPSYGFMIGFFLTFGIAFLAIPRRRFSDYAGIFLRALVAGLGSSILYLMVGALCIALHIDSTGFMINLVPWTLSSFLIAYVATRGTRIKLKRSIILVAVAVSVVSMYLWSSLYMVLGVDFRVLLLYSYMIYAVGMVLAIASAAPRSEHYFLHVHGAVKAMDVALYKWFRANPSAVVSIGRSVDCSLQLSWDLQGNVAPVHAEIRLVKGVPKLYALEDGVLVSGKSLPLDRSITLYHGTSFQIGQTSFSYLEKDL